MIVRLNPAIDKTSDSYANACEPNQLYFVYAITESNLHKDPEFMINVWGLNTNNTIYSIPAHYFEIVDKTIPADWEENEYDVYGAQVHIKAFPEIARDKFFYAKLMDDDPETLKVFKRYAQKYEKLAQDHKETAS